MSTGAAARCGQLNIGDQIIAINGLSLVGLPLSTCQTYIRNTKNQTAVKFTVVPCPPVVEVKIKRPNTKYQLGFSVQNGVVSVFQMLSIVIFNRSMPFEYRVYLIIIIIFCRFVACYAVELLSVAVCVSVIAS